MEYETPGLLYYPVMYRHASGGRSYAIVRGRCLREALERAGEIAGKGVTVTEIWGMGERTQQDARDKWLWLDVGSPEARAL